MTARKAKFDIYANLPDCGIVLAAQAALLEQDGVLTRMSFRYNKAYLDLSGAISLDPIALPLASKTFEFHCSAPGLPGILDDYLPDLWGRRVLASLAFYKTGARISEHSPIDLLMHYTTSTTGALQWVQLGAEPQFDCGAPLNSLARAEAIAHAVDSQNYDSITTDEQSLVYLANAGSGVGGARPKALITDSNNNYLAKFNSNHLDRYNNARVELACFNMAREAGLNVVKGQVVTGINDREALLLERFDTVGEHRRHLITVNALLKDPRTCRDPSPPFRYDDIQQLISRHSTQPQQDLEQLLRLMLFNAGINNLDDHERNFSFWFDGDQFTLAPAYDLVPSLNHGQYPIAGFGYSPFRPGFREVKGRVFGLPAPQVKRIAEEVGAALEQWPRFTAEADVSEQDLMLLSSVINQ